MLTHTDMHTGDLNWCLSGWWPSTTFRNKLTSTNIKKCVNDRNLCSFSGGGAGGSQFCSSYVCKECKVQHVGLMEKLIRGQSSHPNLLTHFHPSHYAPLHLPLSVSHSPTAVNELMLSHTLCLQLYLFLLPTVQCRRRERRGCLLPQLENLHFHPAVSPSSLRPRARPVCERQIANWLYPCRRKVVTGARSH